MTITKPPTSQEAEKAKEALRVFTALLKKNGVQTVRVRLEADGLDKSVSGSLSSSAHGESTILVPKETLQLFLEILGHIANEDGVRIVPIHAELTTQQAADLLNVSRPHLISLIQDGKIPFRLVGTHRRIKFGDLLEYKRKDDARRKAIADELEAEAQKHNLGY